VRVSPPIILVAPHGYRRGRPRPAPEPTPRERQIVLAMAASDCTQVAIADVLNIPRTRIRIWYRRMGLASLSRLEGHMRGRSDAREGPQAAQQTP
jgi:hypothetical protein